MSLKKEKDAGWKKLKPTQFSSSHSQLTYLWKYFISINVGRKLMSSLDWAEYINFCNAALIICNKQLKVALIQFVRSGVKNVFLSKELVKITTIFSCTDWTPDNRACLECALMQITGDTLSCYRLRVLTGHSDMAPGYRKAGKYLHFFRRWQNRV